MNISIHALEEKLIEKKYTILKTPELGTFLSAFCYDAAMEELNNNSILYIFDRKKWEMYVKNPSCSGKPDIILLDALSSGDTSHFNLFNSILLTPKGTTLSQTLETLSSIFQYYAAWKSQVLEMILNQEDFSLIIDTISTLSKNPICLIDNNSFILGKTSGFSSLSTGTIWDNLHGRYFSIYEFYTSSEWNNIINALSSQPQEPYFLCPQKDSVHTYYIASVNPNSLENGSIGLVNVFSDFTKGELANLELIRQMLHLYLKSYYRVSKSNTLIDETFHKLINGNTCTSFSVQQLLASRHWKEEEYYYLLAIQYPIASHSEIELASYINLLKMKFPKALAAVSGQNIILILRQIDYHMEDSVFLSEFYDFLKKNHLLAGCSFCFRDFSQCFHYLSQCLFSLELAGIDKKICILYKDIHAKHILKILNQNSEMEYLVLPKLKYLYQSSKKSERMLLECLQAYLQNSRNISETVRSLGSHRNTVIYRLHKLETLLDIQFQDLSDGETFSLLLSCYILLQHTN